MSRIHLLTRTVSTALRALEFGIAAFVLGIFSYYLAVLSKRNNSTIPTWEKAVEGMSGAAVIYTAFAVILTFFLGGITFFAFLAVLLDICFCGCFVAIAVLTRGGASSCGSADNSPIGPNEHTSCQLQRAAFVVSVIAAVLFLISAGLQVLLSRSHKREKRYGPGPSNNYTSGSGQRQFWQRKNRKNKAARDAELGAIGGAGALAVEDKHHHNNNRTSTARPSDDTAVTATAPVADGYGGPNTKYVQEPTLPAHSAGYTPQTAWEADGRAATSVPEMPADEVHLR